MTESTTTKSEPTGEERDAALKASYQSALKTLREKHVDEFNDLRVAEAAKRGITWTPPKTEEQKAQEQIDALLAKHPGLRENLAASAPVADESVPETHVPHPAAEQDAQRI